MAAPTLQIGVTYTGTDEKHHNYVQWLQGNEAIKVHLLSPSITQPASLIQLDGIVLSGGIDIHPRFYGNTHLTFPFAPKHFNEERDLFEMDIFRNSQQLALPVLAVCRGLQLVNCLLGGTLLQDIGMVANAIHRHGQNDKAHGINLVSGTLLQSLTGLERTVVNSAHHQGIDQLAPGLRINCRSDDGLVEGAEWADPTGKAFFIGVQWHPERMYQLHLADSPVSKNLRDQFINEAGKKNGISI